MEKHMLDHYIPDKVLGCKCLYIKLGSIEGDGVYPGRTHLLEHLLVAFDKSRTEEERRSYIIQAHTTFWYMCFTIYYNRNMVSDETVCGILDDIRMARSIQMELFESCKEDVIQEIERFRPSKERMFINIGNPVYLEKLPIGRSEVVSTMTPLVVKELICQKYLKAEANLVHIKVGKLRYKLGIEKKVMKYAAHSQRALNMIFYEIIFFTCAFGLNLSLLDFHMTMIYERLYVAISSQHLADMREKLENEQLFKESLREVCRRYGKAQEFSLEQQIRIIGECLYANERILRLSDVKRILRFRSGRWLYTKYREYIKSITILKLN